MIQPYAHRFLAFIFISLLMAGCGTSFAAQDETEEDADEAPVVISVPTATPATNASIAVATDPTDAPTQTTVIVPTAEPTATPTAEPTATPTAQRVALIRFRDNEYARAGDFTILANALPPAPRESQYDLWLTQGGQPAFRLGNIPSHHARVNFSAGTQINLLAMYDGALLSLETERSPSGELGPVVLQGSLPRASLQHIRHVVDRFAANPNGQGFLPAARAQLQLAQEHARMLRDALAADDLREARRHAEHVINILNGETGALFGDLDGDGVPQNPGDGIGVLSYGGGAKEHTRLAASADDATNEVQAHAEHTLISLDNTLSWVEEGVQIALRVLAADSPAEARPSADALLVALDSAYNGVDVNGDGVIAPVVGEGGLATAYEHALNMGAIELFATNPSAVVGAVQPAAAPPPSAGESYGAAPAAATDAATPAPAASPTPIALTIEMFDFEFSQPRLTVPAGTTVTWVNSGSMQHSATADNGSFNTGLLPPGESASILFNVSGVYAYYCELHGGADGKGMSATIVVE